MSIFSPPQKDGGVLPRLTSAATVQAIAQKTGKDPSTIRKQLDKRRDAKREQANRHPLNSLEFALRYAVDKIGIDAVAERVGIGRDSLYKALNPNMPDRLLPDIGIFKVGSLIAALKAMGHTEFFTSYLCHVGETSQVVNRLPSLHHALTLSTFAHGDVAREIILAADGKDGDLSPVDAARILDALGSAFEAIRELEQQVRLATIAAGAA